MSRKHQARLNALFDRAVFLSEPERARLLDEYCAGDSELRAEADELLRLAFHPVPALQPGSLAGGPLLAALADEELAEDELEPGRRIGAWRILGAIGRGGMGIVYRVERADGEFRQPGALKLVRSLASSGEIARRLRRERRILASLTHANIARLLDGGQTDDGRPFLVMEYVEGRPIDRYCDEEQLTIDDRLDLFLRVCLGLQHAHRHLVVHRDVKPSNIVVTGDGDVKLLDFGIARLLSPADDPAEDALSRPLTRILTPEYASPEQVRGGAVGIASDVYQLGLLLYELLTGHQAQTVTAVAPASLERVVCETSPVRPSTRAAAASPETAARRRTTARVLARKLKGDLDTIVLCALRKEPERRYGSVSELLDDVRRYRQKLPVRARRDSWSYRAAKFVARHRTALVWSAAALVAGLLTLQVLVEQRWRAEREAARAVQIEQLIERLFAFPNPRVRAEPSQAVTYVDHAVGLVRTELAAEPESQARLLTRLGRVYNALGHYRPSIGVLEEALALYRSRPGADEIDVADTLEWLGQSHHYLGQYAAAETWVREALAIRRRRQGVEDPDTIRTSVELGDLLHTRGSLREAEQLLREVVETLRERALVPRLEDRGHDSLPRSIRDLAAVLRDRGVLDESAALYDEAISMFRTLHGDPNQQVATTQLYFSRLLIMRAEFDEAETMLTESLSTLRRIYAGDHALVGMALRNLAYLRIQQGRLDDAAARLDQAQRIQREWLGPDHPMVARARAHEAELALRRGRAGDAMSLARQTLEHFDRLDMAEHPSAIDARGTLGAALLGLGRQAAAARELTAALAGAERQFVASDARLAALRALAQRAREADRH